MSHDMLCGIGQQIVKLEVAEMYRGLCPNGRNSKLKKKSICDYDLPMILGHFAR